MRVERNAEAVTRRARAATVPTVHPASRPLPALAVLAALVVTGCGTNTATTVAPAAAETVTVDGHLLLEDAAGPDPTQVGSACYGTGGYDDIEAGATVRLASDDGARTIALGGLQPGVRVDNGLGVGDLPCRFDFTIPDVPAADLSGAFYAVEVTHRGLVRFSREQVRSGAVALTLG